jgi:cyclic pyranopterin phosphate synthase
MAAAIHAEPVLDALARPLGTLRLSVTDRCNLRCSYCMPEDDYTWLPRQALLEFEELARLAGLFARLGAKRVRLTGGEPLLRRDLSRLVELLSCTQAIETLALTTNGVLLLDQAADLKRAGLGAVTVSLDTLRADRFAALTQKDELARVLRGIEAARALGFVLKLDMVVMRGVNDDEIGPMLEFARSNGAELRFIEYMDVAGATRWSQDRVVTRSELLAILRNSFGEVSPTGERTAAPAESFRLADGTRLGIIASMSAPFCRACDRSRLTADGLWLYCLYAESGFDLKAPLRAGASDDDLVAVMRERWGMRADRGAELRASTPSRAPLVPVSALRRDPHLEMHTRGG